MSQKDVIERVLLDSLAEAEEELLYWENEVKEAQDKVEHHKFRRTQLSTALAALTTEEKEE